MFRDCGNNEEKTPEVDRSVDKDIADFPNTLERIRAYAGLTIALVSSFGGAYKHYMANQGYIVERLDNDTICVSDEERGLRMDVLDSQIKILDGDNRYEVKFEGEDYSVLSLDASSNSNKEISGEEMNLRVVELCDVLYDALGDAVSEISQKRDFENDWNLSEDSEIVISGSGNPPDLLDGFDTVIDGVEYRVEFDNNDALRDEDKIGFDD